MHRLDIGIAAIATLGAGVLAGIGFDGYDELGLRLDAPHSVNEVARIGSAKLQTKLAAKLTRAQSSFITGGTEIGEASFDVLRRGIVHVGAHFGNANGH